MARFYEWLDVALGWMERTEWGRRILGWLGALLMGYWATIRDMPLYWVVLSAIVILWMLTSIQATLVAWLRLKLGPPVEVTVTTVGYGQVVSIPVHIVNKSRHRRVALGFRCLRITPINSPLRPLLWEGPTELEGIESNLGPETQTEGTINIRVFDNEGRFKGDFHLDLLIVDHVSGRRVWMHVPGIFPPRRPA